MFLKPANSVTENGIKKKIQKCHLKKIMYSESSNTGKVKNELYMNNIIYFYIVFHFKTSRFFNK